jgi:glycosyltransferase involved in cell wall biosynthesis
VRRRTDIRIGYGPRDYVSFRAFQRVPVPGATFHREPYLPIRRLGRVHRRFRDVSGGVGCFFPTGRVDLHHSFNAVLLNRIPWVVTFECQFPRVWNAPRLTSFLLRRASDPSCRRIIAMSENAKLHLVSRNREDPSLPGVLVKTVVIPSSLEDDREAFESRKRRGTEGPAHLVFVGNEFFRKGGDFAVTAFERLKRSFPLGMTVVSSMSETNDVYRVTPGSAKIWQKRMGDLGVIHLSNLSTGKVREVLSTADVLLLPTLEDSYGYSMIEAMATGVAVVATDVEAIPEIVTDGESGLLVPVPKTEEGRIIYAEEVGERITAGLVSRLEDLLGHRENLREMGMKGRRRYDRIFRPDVVGERLSAVYRQALDGERP